MDKLLLNHVLPQKYDSTSIGSLQTLKSVTGFTYNVSADILPALDIDALDIRASNGIVHLLNDVLLQSVTPPASVEAFTIAETAAAAGIFKTLLAALEPYEDLVSAVSTCNVATFPDGITLFAPTDKAFSKLTQLPSGDALKAVLLDHVAVRSIDLTKVHSVKMLSGKQIPTKGIHTKAFYRTLHGPLYILNEVIVL